MCVEAPTSSLQGAALPPRGCHCLFVYADVSEPIQPLSKCKIGGSVANEQKAQKEINGEFRKE